MALKAWYKLDGDSVDAMGFQNGSNSNITWSTSGKIAGAAIFNNSTITLGTGNTWLPMMNFTFACWIKTPGFGVGMSANGIFSLTYGLTFYLTSNGNPVFRMSSPTGTMTTVSASINLHDDLWHHIAVGFDDKTKTRFIAVDGVKLFSGIYNDWGGVTNWMTNSAVIGQENNNGSVYRFNGLIDDFRVYDHALTDMEIQELARAKILHYTFDDMQEPTTNLIVNPRFNSTNNWSLSTNGGGTFSVSNNYGKITMGTPGSYNYIAQNLTKSNTNKTVTLSAKFKNNVVGNCALRLVIFDGGSVPAQPLSVINLDGTGGIIFGSVTASYSGTATAYRLDILSGSYYGGLSDITIEFTEVQLEEKSYATEFTEGSRTGRVNDYSGFFNHSDSLTEATTPKWTADSKIGTGAYYFNGSGSPMNIIDVDKSFGATQEAYTIAFWAKSLDAGTGNMPISDRLNTNFYWYGDNSWRYVHGASGEFYYPRSVSIPIGSWGHFCVTYDGANVKIYRNGVFEGQQASTGTANFSNGFRIGNWASSSTYQYNGYIDDVRIYATALSANDIKDLYEARAEIEELGVLYAKDFLSNCEETVNEFSFPNFDTATSTGGWSHWGQTGSSGSYGQNTDRQFIYDKFQNYSHWVANNVSATGDYLLYQSPPTEATYRSLSCIIKLEDSSIITNSKVYPVWNAGVSPTIPNGYWTSIDNLGGGFYYCKAEGIYQDGSNDLVGVYIKPGVKAYFSIMQLEKKEYATPFTLTYRPASQLPSTIQFGANEIHETGTANFEDFSTVGITDGLVGYWQLNYNSKDYSGNNYNGTNYGSMPILDGSTYFNGAVTNYIQLPNSTITNLGDFTFSFFAKFTNISKAINTIFHATNTGGNDLSLEFYSNMVRPVLNTGSYFSYNTTNLNNVWYHFVIKRTGSTIEVIKDNISLGINTYPTTVYSITGAIILGHEQDAVGGGFDAMQSFEGYLSNFKLFNRALTAEEIAIEYNTMFKNEVQIHESGVLYAKDLKQY